MFLIGVTGTTAGGISTTALPANSFVTEVLLQILAAGTGAGTIAVGTTGKTVAFMPSQVFGPTGTYRFSQITAVGATAQQVLISVSGGQTAGSAYALVAYGTPQI
jgi:hypothetical protein